MKTFFDIKRFKFYLQLGGAYLLLRLFIDLVSHPGLFLQYAVNEIWLVIYVIVLNFILFEYTIPFIKLTWKRILMGLLLIWVHIMFYSFGLSAWRRIGIR